MLYKKGTELNKIDQEYVLNAYVHRYTKNHKPLWAHGKRDNGSGKMVPYMPQFESDIEWLEHTLFAVKKNGRLDMKTTSCQSEPTWPDGIEPNK